MAVTKRLGEVIEAKATVVIAGASGACPHGTIVKRSAAQRVVTRMEAVDDKPFGVTLWDMVAGDQGTVGIRGRMKIRAGAAFGATADLTVDNEGRVVEAATAGDRVVAEALEASLAEDDLVLCIFHQNGPLVPA